MDRIFRSILDTDSLTSDMTIDPKNALIIIFAAMAVGFLTSGAYMLATGKKGTFSQNFMLTLVALPPVVALIILVVGSSLAGAFSLVRFRSAPGDPKDILYVFLALGGGFACGRGYITYGIFFVILICVVLILLTRFGYGTRRCEERQLRIKIPEDLNYADAFNDILEKYTKSYKLERIKSIDLGALFELTYHVILKNDTDLHAFIDELRCRNGNLTIALTVLEENAGFQV